MRSRSGRRVVYVAAMVLFSAFLAQQAFAQQVFHIGDAIEVQDGNNWIPGRIEAVDNDIAKIRTGSGKDD